eukprot:491700_1
MMTSSFFALCLMITWVSALIVVVDDFCKSFTSNTKSNCDDHQFRYCRMEIGVPKYHCADAPTSYHVTVTVPDATGYYSQWVERSPNDVLKKNNKPIYVKNGHEFYIWWSKFNTWILNTKVGRISESISECDEPDLFNCPWFGLCVSERLFSGRFSGYYSRQVGEEYMYYRSDGDYEFKIFYYGNKWVLKKYKSGVIVESGLCEKDIIFDCWWATQYDSEICGA